MNAPEERYRRPQSAQQHPRRNAAGGPTDTQAHYAAPGSIDSVVRTAYSVIDDYMRRGYEAATHHHDKTQWSGAMDEGWNNYKVQSNFGGPGSQLMTQLADAMRAWTTLLYGMSQAGSPQSNWDPYAGYPGARPSNAPPSSHTPAGSPADPGGAHTAPPAAAAPSISVKVSSDRPTEVIPNLASTNPGEPLSVDDLVYLDGEAPPITAVTVRHEGSGPVEVSVTVIPDLPAGSYSGAIRNGERFIVGGLTVVLH